jgi:hypothetical protein
MSAATTATPKEIREIEQERRDNQLAKYGKVGGAKKVTVKKTVAKKPTVKKAVAKKTAKKSPVKKAVAKKKTVKKTVKK